MITEHFLRFERVGTVEATDHGLTAQMHGELLRIDLVRSDIVRVKISRGGTFDESPTYAVCVDPLGEDVQHTVERADDVVRLRTADLVVSLWLNPFRLDVHRTDGSAVVETAGDDDGRFWGYATLNNVFTLRRRCAPEDAVYGLGEKSGRQNRRGRDFTLWNTDVLDPHSSSEFTAGRPQSDPRSDSTSTEFDPHYVSIPFFYHQSFSTGQMAASFVDNGYRGHYDFSDPSEYRIQFDGGQYTEYLFAGPDMPALLAAYTWLTGRMAPPPLWALGYHQCRWFRYTQDAVEQIAAQHRSRDIPCDALWLDIDYMDGYRVFTWDEQAFPDVAGMLGRLDERGFKVITIVDPGVKAEPGYRIFDQARERDVLCKTEGGGTYIGQVWPGSTAFPDFATQAARDWWGELNAAHVASGLAGIWNDMNEPATGTIAAGPMRFGAGQYSHERFHNQYALLMAMGTTAGLLAAMPQKRTFVLSRAGSAGIQRYAANWLGDNQSRWDHLWLSMPMAGGLGISGQAFVGADIGGFQGNSNAELSLRWIQYGVLTPFCRNHSEIGTVDQYAWTWGPVIEEWVRDAIRLRYRLMPYLYASFLKAAETGAPVQRPLVFDHQYDRTVRDIDDEFLCGPDLLVAPVFEPGCTARQVYLPEGTWYDWHSDEVTQGGTFVVVPTPMATIPIFARGGSVIPMWPDAPPSTAGYHPSVIELHLFVPGADGTYTSLLQEDDGLTFASLEGSSYRTTITVTRTGDRLAVRGDVTGDGYPEFRREELHLVVHGAAPDAADVGGTRVPVAQGRLCVANTGTPFGIAFDL